MKKLFMLCLMASFAAGSLHAQAVKLPTKKTKVTTETTEKQTPPQREEKKPEVKQEVKEEAKQAEPAKSGSPITLPTVKKDNTATPTAPTTPTVATAPQTGGPLGPLPVVKRKTEPRAKPIIKKPKPEDNEIYESAEHMPTYPGGVQELMNFITENLHYPEACLDEGVEDIIQVSFIVEKDGSCKDFEVIDEHNPYLEAEAVRVLEGMPKWNPARHNGVKVRVEYVVPVKFRAPANSMPTPVENE